MHAPLPSAYRIEWRALASLEDIHDAWHGLAARALEPNVFYEPAFARNAAPVFGADAGVVLVWSALGRLMGMFPGRLMRWRGGPGRTLTGWTHPYAPLGVPLVDRDEAEAVITAWLDHLASDRAMPALLMLPMVPEQGAFATALDAVLLRSKRPAQAFDRHRRALLAPGAQRAGYLDRSVSAGRRKELRRQRRRLQEIAPVTFTTATGESELAPALKDYLVIEASGWKGLAGTAAVSDPKVRSFLEGAVTALAAEGKARVHRLFLNGRAIAASITLNSGPAAWCWKITYSEGLARSSPGVQLALDVTETLLGDPSVTRVDSCATADHPMIDRIWLERMELSDRLIAVKPLLIPFRLACRAEALRRAALHAAKRLKQRLGR